jgi:UDP-N-acetylglucosamine 2-epimerase (non-hydrolysing)
MKKISVIAGTRPEIIKLAPVVWELSTQFSVQLVLSGQHASMAAQAVAVFGLQPHCDLGLMVEKQTPTEFIARAIEALTTNFLRERPELVLVQGDTATAYSAALAAFHLQIPVAHVEAGLRTGNLKAPFPEEGYRRMISQIASFHFCPTPRAAKNLAAENITEQVFTTGNTVIDSLSWMHSKLQSGQLTPSAQCAELLRCLGNAPLLFVTGHRRENHDEPLKILCEGIRDFAIKHPKAIVVFPVHLNPKVQGPIRLALADIANIALLPPLDYVDTISVLNRATVIVSDSGGIQEEAPFFGTYVLITRTDTERPELIEAQMGELSPLVNAAALAERLTQLVASPPPLSAKNIFGDGTAAKQITAALAKEFAELVS